MRTYIYQLFFGLSLVLLMPIVTLAQEPRADVPTATAGPAADEDLLSDSPAIADVFLYDVSTSSAANGLLSGNFSLLGRMGQENDIIYGLAAFNDKGALLHSAPAGLIQAIAEGEVKELAFQYEVPEYLTGAVTFMLVLENKDGMLVGFREIDRRTLAGDGPQFSCLQDDEALDLVRCKSSADTVLTLSASPLNILGDRTPVGREEMKAGQEAAIEPAVGPGRYYVFVADPDGKTVIVPVVKSGSYGKITNIAVYKNVDGTVEATIPVYGSGLKDSVMSITLKNANGKVCTETSQKLSVPVFIFAIDDSCTAGTIKAEFTNATGLVFDTQTEAYSIGNTVYETAPDEDGEAGEVPTPTPDMGESQNSQGSSALVLVALILLLIVMAGALAYRMKKDHSDPTVPPTPPVPPVALILLFGLFALSVPFQSVHALTFHPYLYSQARGEYAWDAWVNITLDQATYAPGETAVITAAGTVMSDAGASTGATGNSYAYYYLNAAGTTAAFDAEANGITADIASITAVPRDILRSYSGSASFLIPASMTSGAHTVRLVRATVSGGCYGTVPDPCTGQTNVTNALGFTVVPNTIPNTPTISGPATGSNGSTLTYTFDATDPDGDQIRYLVDWESDGAPYVTVPSSGYVNSGTARTASNSWTTAGTQTFRVRAQDDQGASSAWRSFSVVVSAPAGTCDWVNTAYLGLNTGNPGMHHTTRCSTPAPSDGTPAASYCNSVAEDGDTVVCCDTGADCFRWTCSYDASCVAPPTTVNLDFQ